MKKKLLFGFYLFVIVFVLSEITLRYSGYRPGCLKNYENFELVDSLIVYDTYVTDEHGIYKLNPKVGDSISKYYDPTTKELENDKIGQQLQWWQEDIQHIYKVFGHLEIQIKNGVGKFTALNPETSVEAWSSEFTAIAKELYKSNHEERDLWSKLYLEYLEKPFSSEGFRSVSFDTAHSNRQKILLLGDSFAYGMSCNPYFNSFSDILLSRGYIVYNTGIIGTDPAQYAAVAKKYIPILKPDIVILNFFSGNDLMPFEREVHPDKPHEHLTNAGFLESMPAGEYLNPQEAYQFYIDMIRIPDTDNNIFNLLCSKSSVMSLIWVLCHSMGIVDHPQLDTYLEINEEAGNFERARITRKYIEDIQYTCKKYSTALISVVIPQEHFLEDLFKIKITALSDEVLDTLFGADQYHHPYGLFKADEDYANAHFNNQGALKYADLLDSLIQQHNKKYKEIK